MNCNTCRYELSQCLDGRLPSGRRAAVMQHTAACEPCATFWEELQAAQRLILQLPGRHAGESFRDQLWQRIRAGEGTHDAIFREPLPMLVKVRYALTGAAAAAVLLLGVLWWQDRSREVTRDREDVAAAPQDDTIPFPRQPVRTIDQSPAPTAFVNAAPALLGGATRLNTGLLANEAAYQAEQSYASVSHRLRQLRQRQERDPGLVERIVSEAIDLSDCAQVLLDLRDRDWLSFRDPAVSSDLQFVTRMVGQVRQRSSQDLDAVQTFIQPVVEEGRHLRNLRDQIRVSIGDAREEQTVIIHITTTQPEVFPKLFINVGPLNTTDNSLGVPPQSLLLFQDFCESFYVTPRRLVEQRIR